MLKAMFLGILFFVSTFAFAEESGQPPTERKAENSETHKGDNDVLRATPFSVSPTINVTTDKHADVGENCGYPKNWNAWPSFSWCITLAWINAERVIAIFTIILGIATWLLWRATDRLVKGAEETAQRQLRAYISVTPKLVINWTQEPKPIIIGLNVKNHGETPGLELHYEFSVEALGAEPDWENNTHDHIYNQNTALFPDEELPVRLGTLKRFTDDEIKSVNEGSKRIHTWGTLYYGDVFGYARSTIFSFSFGGPDFAKKIKIGDGKGWNWHHGQHHNEPI